MFRFPRSASPSFLVKHFLWNNGSSRSLFYSIQNGIYISFIVEQMRHADVYNRNNRRKLGRKFDKQRIEGRKKKGGICAKSPRSLGQFKWREMKLKTGSWFKMKFLITNINISEYQIQWGKKLVKSSCGNKWKQFFTIFIERRNI